MLSNWTPGAKFDLIQIPPPKLPVCVLNSQFLRVFCSRSELLCTEEKWQFPVEGRMRPNTSKIWDFLPTSLLLALWRYLMASRRHTSLRQADECLLGNGWWAESEHRGNQRVGGFTIFQISPTSFPFGYPHIGLRNHGILEFEENRKFWKSGHSSFNHLCTFSSHICWVLSLHLALTRPWAHSGGDEQRSVVSVRSIWGNGRGGKGTSE